MTEIAEQLGTILVADDEPDHAKLLDCWLGLRGYRCLVASNGQATLEMARAHHPDLILLDVNMPDMNGYEVCGRLKADPITADTPIIFLTGRGNVAEKVEGLARGASDYVTKPYDLPELLARVQAALRMKAAVEALKAEQSRLQFEATTDNLTGVANRAYFNRRLVEEFAAAERDGSLLACLMLDIDHFKHVNDRYGHLAGDLVLRDVGQLLRANVRAVDIPARYGGEEFAVLMPGAPLEGARALGERVRTVVERHAFQMAVTAYPLRITISAGAAVRRRDQKSPEALIEEADRALYRAKLEGRNRVVVAS